MVKQVYAISCINVGVGPGGTTSMLARIVIVDFQGQTILDTYVQPTMKVTDYRTAQTGIESQHLYSRSAASFDAIQKYVANTIEGHILVGHNLWHDLSVLGISHPAVDTRDVNVTLYQSFRNANHVIGLQTLSWQLMWKRRQEGEQNPLENARAALDLYISFGFSA
ncbi:hypothetical protein K435DRAFT_895306 [Dendrothele bispora CBS 962.96]|uniref:RNA exonuclease 4 n=1 Tax=Dendrothele bispora (strain CBS 962.96) TaxID=1314807 RepID=A0A4V4HI55_DENBC|nr:hypothetical protein K435DRAFT_895306 [Dendrothele bispora CBS 962.96]